MSYLIKRRTAVISDNDAETLRILRQMVVENDRMKMLGMIGEEEYEQTGLRLLQTVMDIEAKYGIKNS